jgi:hypothetical protein
MLFGKTGRVLVSHIYENSPHTPGSAALCADREPDIELARVPVCAAIRSPNQEARNRAERAAGAVVSALFDIGLLYFWKSE